MKTLITIPHHSTSIPKKYLADFLLTEKHMNRHLDFGTEKIFELKGFDVIKADASRFVVDLNRQRDDIREGQGVIITETWDGEPVLKESLSSEKIEHRLKNYYDPFYTKLDSFLAKSTKPLFVLDGHSMDSKGSLVAGDSGNERPEIDLATGRGTCPEYLVKIFEDAFSNAGFECARNNPYSGERAKIIHYCTAHENVHALELEVNKKVYMDEKTFKFRKENLARLKSALTNALNKIQQL
ncbi:MAG: hypothetical protein COV47_05760 [Candidatus Diapherotrites archaeon CG11_big_fil_rev_8_21_14_0_20_37_9]|nr:MAG: hypothetical protein COV47_05760 [Candidatus Diapherotrites archaeon CG11_big_fil_rev_8_21_14_0_20_37_9]